MIDIVFPLGRGSIWADNEIRYSLRSIEKHLSNYRNIWIIGQCPSFLKDVRLIPFEDTQLNKEANIYQKILRACNEPEISDDFLFFNDDHFLLQDFVADQFPYYHKGTLDSLIQRHPHGRGYFNCIRKTIKTLRDHRHNTLHFDIHTPIIYNKAKFVEVMPQYDWGHKIGLVVKSMYCNTLKIEGERILDCKIGGPMIAQEIYEKIKDKKVLSIGNKVLGPQLEIVLNELYPTKSRWEI